MNFIIEKTKWVMLISGLLTFTMFYGVFAPQAALELMFGVSFNGELENIVIRSWSALVGIMGAILIYSFISAKSRSYSITIAAFSKFVFVMLLVLYGQEFISVMMSAIVMDCFVIITSCVYLLSVRMKVKTVVIK